MPIDQRITQFKEETDKVLHFLHGEYAKLQTGRANAAIIENVDVNAYDMKQPLKAVAGISVEDARTIVVQPWDKSLLGNVEKALTKADLGSSPINDGSLIRLVLPPMTEERRTMLKKNVHQLAEEARISVRHLRQTAHESIKKESDEDKKFTLLEELEKSVGEANEKIEKTMKDKEEEIMTV